MTEELSAAVQDRPANAPPQARFIWVCATFSAGYVVLGVAVYLGLMDPLDRRIAEWARPDNVWLTLQRRANAPVDWFSPMHMVAGLVLFFAIAVLVRRSLRTVFIPMAAGLAGGAATLLSKFAVGRPDLGGLRYTGGSFPSGHAFTVTLVAGLVLLLIWPKPRWWHLLLPVVPGVAMAACIVIIGLHWAGDVLGSVLLGEAVLAAAAAWSAATLRTGPQAGKEPIVASPGTPADLGAAES